MLSDVLYLYSFSSYRIWVKLVLNTVMKQWNASECKFNNLGYWSYFQRKQSLLPIKLELRLKVYQPIKLLFYGPTTDPFLWGPDSYKRGCLTRNFTLQTDVTGLFFFLFFWNKKRISIIRFTCNVLTDYFTKFSSDSKLAYSERYVKPLYFLQCHSHVCIFHLSFCF